jgi:hypothetical protein
MYCIPLYRSAGMLLSCPVRQTTGCTLSQKVLPLLFLKFANCADLQGFVNYMLLGQNIPKFGKTGGELTRILIFFQKPPSWHWCHTCHVTGRVQPSAHRGLQSRPHLLIPLASTNLWKRLNQTTFLSYKHVVLCTHCAWISWPVHN